MWGSFSQTVTNKQALEAAQDRLHTVRVALMRMTREIEMAYLSDRENTRAPTAGPSSPAPPARDVDELTLLAASPTSACAPAPPKATPLSSSYYGARDPDDRRVHEPDAARDPAAAGRGLRRRIPGETYMLCPDVDAGEVRSTTTTRRRSGRHEWNTLNAGGAQYLPSHVRITLT